MRLGYKHYKPESKNLNISSYSENIQNICKIFSNDPFISMEEVSNEIKISKDDLISISNEIRNNDYLQEYIMTQGTGRKYWENTVASLMESGKLIDAIKNKPSYPNRIGLFPGLDVNFFVLFVEEIMQQNTRMMLQKKASKFLKR